jgi:hypothetical protein
MKIQLDTKSKTVKLEESVNLGELQELLEKFLPDNQWKEYKLETNTVINNWSNPIIIDRYVPRPHYPWWSVQPYVTTNQVTYNSKSNDAYSSNEGVYNLSIN